MGKGEKSIFHNLRVLIRRGWSFTSFRISLISVVLINLIILFISQYNPHKDRNHETHIESLSLFRNITNNKRIACLVVGDSGFSESLVNKEMYYLAIQQLFEMLATYDKYLHSYCDIKIFLVNTSISSYYYYYNSTQIANKLPHSEITFIPYTKLRYWQKRRFHNVYLLSYTYKHYLNDYEWYLKFHDTTNLVFVDNFEKLVFENNLNKFDMTKSQILGHYIQYDECTDFIYGLSLYAMNNQFIKQIGSLAYKQVENNAVIVDDIIECQSSNCKHHTENDFGAFCLDDLNINIGPTRDELQAEYFLIFQIKDHYFRMNEWRDNDWYWIGKNKQSVGNKCCAQYPIAFSNYRKHKIGTYYQQIYSQKPEDRNIKFMATNLNSNKLVSKTLKRSIAHSSTTV